MDSKILTGTPNFEDRESQGFCFTMANVNTGDNYLLFDTLINN